MTRKTIVLLVMMTVMVSMLAGCTGDKPATETSEQKTPTPAADTTKPAATGDSTTSAAPETKTSKYKEAPNLKALVDAGKLPPVEERLPDPEDVMVERKDSVGTYGEAFNFTYGGKGSQWFYGKLTEEALFRFKTDGTVEPNVAKGYDVNDDATVYTIYLRKGMKWSDDEDFTADDVIFFYNEMCVIETFGKSLWDYVKVI